jgi:hypothetical protein
MAAARRVVGQFDLCARNPRLFAVCERPDFVDLHALALEVLENAILIFRARRSGVDQELSLITVFLLTPVTRVMARIDDPSQSRWRS